MKKTPLIIAPSYTVLENTYFQQKLRDAINNAYAEAKEDFERHNNYQYSSRKFQRFIGDSLYDYDGDIYICDDDGRFHKQRLPNIDDVLGDDARWLRGFMVQHRPRRDLYKLMILALFIGIKNPLAYEGLISLY